MKKRQIKMNIINFSNEKRIINKIAGITLIGAFSLCILFANSNVAYADPPKIPDKTYFRKYITEMYQLDEEAANIDEKLENAVYDYKNRYTMYVDIDYVLGKRLGKGKKVDYYNGPTPNVEDVGGDLEVCGAIEEYMAKLGLSIGCQVGNSTYNSTIQYLPLFEKYAKMYGVDPYILVAIACQESGGNHAGHLDKPNAGVGLMQIEAPGKKTTGASAKNVLTGAVDTMSITYNDMCDVELNIKAGTMLFSSKLSQCNGNLYAALQSYNFGSGAVEKTIKAYIKDKGLSATVSSIRGNKDDLSWMAYREVTHQDPPKVGLSGSGGPCNISGCPYQHSNHPSGKKYGDPYYCERILSYYKASGGAAADTLFFQGAVPKDFAGKIEYYGDVKFGKSSLKEEGAGPVAIAMVSSALTKYVTPKEVAKNAKSYYEKNKGSSIDILLDVKEYGLDVTQIGKDTTKLDKALKDGKIAIAVTGSLECGAVSGIFNRSSDGNFIVIFGYKENGYLDVADPDGGNYDFIKDINVSLDLIKGEAVGGFYIYEPTKEINNHFNY